MSSCQQTPFVGGDTTLIYIVSMRVPSDRCNITPEKTCSKQTECQGRGDLIIVHLHVSVVVANLKLMRVKHFDDHL